MYIVIMGCGRLGAQLADELLSKEHDVVVVDQNPNAFDQLGSGFNGMTIVGTGIDLEVQRKAGVDRADVFAALSTDDNTNIMAAQVAKEIFKVPKVIARIYDPKREYAYHQLGLDSICPTNVGADILRNYIEADTICCRLNFQDVDVVEFPAEKALIGKRVDELDTSGDLRIIIITRKDTQHIASPDWVIEDGDQIMAAISHSYREEFKRKWLVGKSESGIHRFWERSRR